MLLAEIGKLDTGNTAFMLVATSLVMLMTPGLAFFYGGLVGRKNVLAIMIQSFVSMGVTTVLWFAFGYSMCFSGGHGAVIGNLDMAFLRGVDLGAMWQDKGFPLLVMIAYQMMFAQITPALITGAFANRVRFQAYLIFLVLWLIFVYFPLVHMVWGDGWLAANGVLDFAGGIVVHCSAGFAALAAVFFVGRRRVQEAGPHSIPLVALGTGLLWFGWYGFNAGSELQVDAVTALAFLNTDLAASFAAIVWLTLAWTFEKKPKFVGLLTGSIAGLAAVTPAAGYISPLNAVVIGIVASTICYFAVNMKNRLGWDDALDVWGVHGVGGVVGCICLGIFADKVWNAAGDNGLIGGGSSFFLKEVAAVVGTAVYAFLFTYVMLWVINWVTRVKVTPGEEEMGLDEALHGEKAYVYTPPIAGPTGILETAMRMRFALVALALTLCMLLLIGFGQPPGQSASADQPGQPGDPLAPPRLGAAAASQPASRPATATSAPANGPRRVHVFVSGHVQGVSFRAFTFTAATRLKLTGWVRNLADGRVELIAEGPSGAIDKLLAIVRVGPSGSMARVDKVEVADEPVAGEFKRFEVAPTQGKPGL